MEKIVEKAISSFRANWLVCRITSGRKSAKYGIRFSYPLYISLVALGIVLVNPYILSFTALIAFFGIALPMHPFDYVYNYLITKLNRKGQIPGRGSELQINSITALLFNIVVIASIIFGIQLNYGVMALIYVASSIFFIAILLSTENFSLYTLPNLFKKTK